MTTTKMYNAAFTPASIVRKKDSLGRSMVSARGTIAHSDGRMVDRTVLVQGKNAGMISRMMKKGREITLRGVYERAPAQGENTRGGEYFTALCMPKAAAATA